MKKKWYKSWTVWFNIALLFTSSVGELSGIVPISPVVVAYAAMIGNLILRFKTTVGIITESSVQ